MNFSANFQLDHEKLTLQSLAAIYFLNYKPKNTEQKLGLVVLG